MLEQEAEALLASGRYPCRNIPQNMADLKAQIAANETGRQALLKVVDNFGLDVVRAYMGHVQDNAEESVRRVIDRLKDGRFTYPMDHGAVIEVKVTVDAKNREATIDFTGTSAAARGELQRAQVDLPGGGAVRVPHDGGGGDPAERRMPEALEHRDPRGLDAEPGLPGGGDFRQYGGEPGHLQRALRGAARNCRDPRRR